MNLTHRIICITVFILMFAGCQERKKEFNRPNILFITTDYTRGEDLPVTGAPFLHAPALTKLCEEGAVFTRHCCNAPICMPARATIATGHYPHSHSLWDNRAIPLKQPGLPLLTTGLKEMGYQTVGIGKMHFHPFKSDGYYDYDIRITLEGKDRNYRDDDYEKYLEERGTSRKELRKQRDTTNIPRGQSFFDWQLDEEFHADAFVGVKTVETIQNEKLSNEKPWFMWVSFTGPHNPWNAPERFARLYRNMDDLPTGNFIEGELNSKPIDYTRHRYGYGGDLMRIYDRATHEEKREIRKNVRAGHYGMLSFIDEWIGKIIVELEEKGQLENTVIIFTSDHGSALFDNEMLHKGASFPTQSLVPFVVWNPGTIKPGLRTEFTTHVDLYSTFLELAGNKNPQRNEGKSLVEVFKTPGHKVNDFVIIESTMVTSIMNDKWLAGFHHITKEVELYDLEKDPMCHFNIANQERSVIAELKLQVYEWRKGLAENGKKIDENPLFWYEELGDTTTVSNYFKGYTKAFKNLAGMNDEAPGVTGLAAQKVLESAGIE